MTNLVALSSQTHRALRVDIAKGSREYAQVNLVGVVPREFGRLVAHFPIFFTKSPESGQFEPAALLGFARGENLFFSPDGWEVPYVPLQLQRLPFALIPRPANPVGGVPAALDLALDLDSPFVQSTEGERLFLDDGKASPYLDAVSATLSALVGGARDAYAFTAKLVELNLLEGVRIDIEFADGTKTQLDGLCRIATNTLKSLPAAQLAELRDFEYLEWLYFHLASLAHVPGLVVRKNKRIQRPAP